MSSLRLSVPILTCIVLVVVSNVGHAADDFPGVVELVGYNNRKARMGHLDTLVTPPMKKTRADIETVKQNIEEYNKLLKVDTKKLSDQQKDMLERIVERVARLKESLDIEVETTTAQASTQQTGKPIATTTTESADAIDEKTNSIPEMLATTILPEQKLTTTTTARPDTSEARANINNLSTSSGTNRVSGKAKIRPNTTRRPTQSSATSSSSSASASTKTTTKRTTGIRPSIKPVGATVSAAVGNTATMPGSFGSTQKIGTITTIQPLIKQQLQKQQDVIHDVLMKQQQQQSSQQDDSAEEKTLSSSSVHHQGSPLGAGAEGSELMYDSNVTTSSLIDSLANHAREDYYNTPSLSESTKEKKPSGTAKPTKYHYYPHNQHIYLLPECAIQQVCNAVYVRLNYTQPLCACPSRYRDPCSASLNEDDQHTTKLIGDAKKKAITLAKTCEATTEMRECRSPKDWSLLALQNTRTGKSHYLVICRCPDHFKLEGPMAHDQPTYASVPGIRVFGMMCVKPGYSVRRPSVQPPKRYQLQKPYYLTNSNQYSSIKDNRPNNYLQDSYQSQHQANYQYLNRPESSPIISSHTEFPEPISLNSFGGGIYGRNNEQKGETIAAEEGSEDNSETTSKREKRSSEYLKDDMPEFPWHRLEEFQRSIIWD